MSVFVCMYVCKYVCMYVFAQSKRRTFEISRSFVFTNSRTELGVVRTHHSELYACKYVCMYILLPMLALSGWDTTNTHRLNRIEITHT